MKSLLRFFIQWPLFANLVTIFVLLSGGMSLALMKREFFPNINFEVITVNTVYPGASASDVERKITSPLEEKLQEIDNVRRFTSISSEGNSTLVIELDPDLADEVEAERDIQNIVDRFEDLPEDAKEPVVSAIEFKDAPLVEIAVQSKLNDLDLRRLARRIERDVEKIRGVARVEPRGLLGEEIRVEVQPEKLQKFRVSINDVLFALNDRNFSLPGGTLEVSDTAPLERIIRTVGDFENEKDVEEAVIRANDFAQAVRVKDIAKVTWGVEKARLINRVDGEAAISLIVVKSEAADAITLVEEIEKFVDQNKEAYAGAKLKMVDDRSIIIRNRLDVLSNNLLQGIALVVIILSLFLSLKVSLLVSLSIPLSFFSYHRHFLCDGH
jgi:multidrug efflux pump subunit AcrB